MEEVLKTILEGLVENKDAISIKVRQEEGKEIYTIKLWKFYKTIFIIL